ncbi:MAG: SBBP repeat-containing protein, partial [Anaerolineales bacterium]
MGGEQVIHRAPYAYQIRHGAKVAVDARYRIHGRTVAFQLGDYDHRRPLIIDPTLIYGSYVGGTGDDTARAVAVDASGNIYITGKTASTDLPQAGNTP